VEHPCQDLIVLEIGGVLFKDTRQSNAVRPRECLLHVEAASKIRERITLQDVGSIQTATGTIEHAAGQNRCEPLV